MPANTHLHSLKFLIDHEKTQELIGRYVEILHSDTDAATMYPDVAVHLSVCRDCRGMFDDLSSSLSNQGDDAPLRVSIIERFAGILPPRSPVNEPPLDMMFRENIILRIAHALPEREASITGDWELPTAGFLLFYDTLSVANIELVALFTLHHEDQSALYRIEGIIFPEQSLFRYKASLQDGERQTMARVDNNCLVFGDLPLGPQTNHVMVTLEGFGRWKAS